MSMPPPTKTTVEFPYVPNEYQLKIHEALATHRFVVTVAHRRFGKTECAVGSLVVSALSATREEGMYGYVAPFLKQAKQIAWRKLKRIANKLYGKNWKRAGVIKNEAELWIQFPSGARIQLFGADNADAMRGLYFDGIVIDEIADMKGEVWNAIIRPALADRQGWCLMIGTPKGINELYRFYQRGLTDPNWKSLMFSVTHTKLPWLPPEEVKALEDDMTESMFRQEMLCDFQASSDDVLFKLDALHRAATRQLRLSDLTGCAKVIGLDVAGAGKGSDLTVLTRKQGLMVWPQQIYKGMKTPEICDMLATQMVEWGADAAIVDNGYGFAVVEQMQRRGFYNVYGVDFGGKPTQPQYTDKKTEMAYRTKKAIDDGLKLPNCEFLFAEAAAHSVRLDKKLKVLEKDKVKEIIKRSPDRFDSLILANAFDVIPAVVNPLANPNQSGTVSGGSVLQGHLVKDFDPYQVD